MEVKEPAIRLLERSLSNRGVANFAAVHGVLVLLVVQHGRGSILAGGLRPFSLFFITTSGGEVPFVPLSELLDVVLTSSNGPVFVKSGEVLFVHVVGVGALARLVANTGNITGVGFVGLVLAEGVFGTLFSTMPKSTSVHLFNNNGTFDGRGVVLHGGAFKPVGDFEFTMVANGFSGQLRRVIDINVVLSRGVTRVVSNNNIVTFFDVTSTLLQFSHALVSVFETKLNFGVGVVANTVSMLVHVVSSNTQTLIFTTAQILANRVRGANTPSLTRRTDRRISITVLGEVEQSKQSPVSLRGSFLFVTFDVKHTISVTIFVDFVDNGGGGARDGEDRSGIVRDDSRPFIKDQTLLQIFRRK
mmetsp:Transcript_26605/g.41432  ORF Transcript_26605/g.41432 Transcript_26605/m.41432 type:complete len:359 (-) Transcript_26605:680-1756(-)